LEKREFAKNCIDAWNNNSPCFYEKNAYQWETENIESQLLNTLNFNEKYQSDAVNSIMKGIQISDSAPLQTSSLVLCRKIDVLKSGELIKLNVCRECLKPGTEIVFDVTIDNIIAGYSNITKEYLRDSIIASAEIQNKQYAKYQKPSGFVTNSAPDRCELYIGGGAGFLSKTFVYAMDENKALKFTSKIMQALFARHFHKNDEANGVSPHTLKCTAYNGQIYQMGKCRVVF
jgi:CRISPR-associated protein Csm5